MGLKLMMPKDLPTVLNIELLSFPIGAWNKRDFLVKLDNAKCTSMVCVSNGVVVGYVVFKQDKGSLEVLNFATHPDHRRKGVASLMMRELMQKNFDSLRMKVPDENLISHLFLKSVGFKATMVDGNFYLFEYNKNEI